MADSTTVPGASWTQVATSLLGGNPNGFAAQTPGQIAQSLLATKAQQAPIAASPAQATPSPQNSLGTYEGNIPTPANPYSNGQYGMPSSGSSTSTPNSTPFQQFPQNMSPVPYLDPSIMALFGQSPPTS